MLQDVHIHIQDLPDTIHRTTFLVDAHALSIQRFFCNATSPADWEAVRVIAAADPAVIPFFGIHPWYAHTVSDGWETTLQHVLEQQPYAGIGEIGLDRTPKAAPFDIQKQILERQLILAHDQKRPFTVHCIRAWDAVLPLLITSGTDVPFIVHSFSGSSDVAEKLLEIGGYFSFSLWLLEAPAGKVQRICEQIPINRILIETDFPYIPRNAKERMTSYAVLLKSVYDEVARIKNIDSETLQQKVWENGTVFTNRTSDRKR